MMDVGTSRLYGDSRYQLGCVALNSKTLKIPSKLGSETERYNFSMGFYPQGVRRIGGLGLRPHFAISFFTIPKVSPNDAIVIPIDPNVTPK